MVQLAPGGNAARGGLRVGDRIVAVSATVGSRLWKVTSLDGVQSAINSRLALHDDIVLAVERPLDSAGACGLRARMLTTPRGAVTQN
jgi:C-terminal processing protease CtpA/Prc